MADVKTDKIDFDRCMMLMNVIEKQASVAPKATHLAGAAHAELMKINDSIKEAAREAEIEKRKAEHKPENMVQDESQPGSPTDEQLDQSDDKLKDELKPGVYPADSKTATIADRRL